MIDLKWNASYNIKNDRINDQHKSLFQIAGKAFNVVDPTQKATKIKSILHELLDYTKTHFLYEEKFMTRIKYDKLEEHKLIHQRIIALMHDFIKSMPNMRINEIEKELAHGIEIWFINHIVIEDKKTSLWAAGHDIPECLLEWKNAYVSNDSSVDAIHQECIEDINKTLDTLKEVEDKEVVKEIFDSLLLSFVKNFANLKDYLESIKFNKLTHFIESETKIINNLLDIVNSSLKIEIENTKEKFYDFTEIVFTQYITEKSIKIALWINFLEDLKEAKELKDKE